MLHLSLPWLFLSFELASEAKEIEDIVLLRNKGCKRKPSIWNYLGCFSALSWPVRQKKLKNIILFRKKAVKENHQYEITLVVPQLWIGPTVQQQSCHLIGSLLMRKPHFWCNLIIHSSLFDIIHNILTSQKLWQK